MYTTQAQPQETLQDIRNKRLSLRNYANQAMIDALAIASIKNVCDGYVEGITRDVDIYCKIGADGKPYWRVDGGEYVDSNRALNQLTMKLY